MPPKKDSGAKATLAKKSLATFKQHSENKIKEVQKFIEKYAQIESMTQDQQSTLKARVEKMEAQIERYETAWDEHYKAILDEDATLEEDDQSYDKYANDLADTIKNMQGVRDAAEDFIANHGATPNANATAPTGPVSAGTAACCGYCFCSHCFRRFFLSKNL